MPSHKVFLSAATVSNSFNSLSFVLGDFQLVLLPQGRSILPPYLVNQLYGSTIKPPSKRLSRPHFL